MPRVIETASLWHKPRISSASISLRTYYYSLPGLHLSLLESCFHQMNVFYWLSHQMNASSIVRASGGKQREIAHQDSFQISFPPWTDRHVHEQPDVNLSGSVAQFPKPSGNRGLRLRITLRDRNTDELSARPVRRMCVEGQTGMAAAESTDGKPRIVKQRKVGLEDDHKLEAQ